MAEKVKMEEEVETNAIKDALHSCTSGFVAANEAAIAASKEGGKENSKFKEKDLELNGEAAELEALKLLFSSNEEESVQYREELRRKRLKKLLGTDSSPLQ